MIEISLPSIRNCLEGHLPSVIATADGEGIPNVSLISQVEYVDTDHVAISYQFFNKTRRNLLSTRHASVAVVDPATNAQYRLALEYRETQTSGPIFEAMRAKLAGIASHTGMQGIFRLLGADIFRVNTIAPVPTRTLTAPHGRNLLSATRSACAQVSRCSELGEAFDTTLAAMQQHFGVEYSMLMMLDLSAERLYTVASRGYPTSGIGSEVALGEGVIGVAARQGVPIRIGHMTTEYTYGNAVRDTALAAGLDWQCQTAIPFPGLKAPQSQLALPILRDGRAIGVLLVESPEPNQFGYEEEDALALLAGQLSGMIALLRHEEGREEGSAAGATRAESGREIHVRHYRTDNTVFIGHDYLIKGVAGAILWRIATEHAATGRSEFTNRELRLDPALRLPEYAENLEARLVLLQRRLAERNAGISIGKCGRGRFRLVLAGKLVLEEV